MSTMSSTFTRGAIYWIWILGYCNRRDYVKLSNQNHYLFQSCLNILSCCQLRFATMHRSIHQLEIVELYSFGMDHGSWFLRFMFCSEFWVNNACFDLPVELYSFGMDPGVYVLLGVLHNKCLLSIFQYLGSKIFFSRGLSYKYGGNLFLLFPSYIQLIKPGCGACVFS